LRVAHERGVFPVYFDRIPNSDAITDCGGVQILVSSAVLNAENAHNEKWKRALLRISRLEKAEAEVALLELPDSLPEPDAIVAVRIEVHLLEFRLIDRLVVHPALLIL
jgi:hypothetical protein